MRFPLLAVFFRSFTGAIIVSRALLMSLPVVYGYENAEKSYNLGECFRLALKQSETLAIQSEVIREAEGRFYQALSGVLPKASFEIRPSWEEDGDDIERDRRDKFTFSQPLFSGFKEFASVSASRAEGRQRRLEEERARQLLFKDVSDAFYYYLSYQEDLDALDKTRSALTERLAELEERKTLGRSRAGEVAQAQARLSRVEAELETVDGRLIVARQLLEFLTGEKITAITDSLEVQEPSDDVTVYLSKTPDRADVKAAWEAAQVAEHQVTAARAGRLPSVDLDGNYYTRPADGSDTDWDVFLTVSFPLFTGGNTAGLIKEKKSLARQAELKFKRAERLANNNIKDAHVQLRSSWRRRLALNKALAAAENNYDLQIEDYRLNLVNNLDVLQALEDLQDARREAAEANNALKRAYWDFKTALGTIDYDAL